MADIRNDQYLHRPGAGRGAITPADPLEVQLMSRSTSKEVNATATTTNQTAAFDVVWISHIVNDGTVDLYVAFDADSTIAANRITIKPGEILEDLPRACSVLHYSCASGTCPFRAVGVK